MPGSILGTAVRRVEDPDLLLGRAQFVDDLPIDGVLHLHFVRSSYAHARLVSIDADAARAMPGVVAVFAAGDLGLPPYEGLMQLNAQCVRPPLAEAKVRFVGDAVAVVVAETRAAAADAAEAVIVEYDALPAVADPEAALAPDAPLQFEELGSNLAAAIGPRNQGDVLEGADVVVRARIENQRIAVMPMEGSAIAVVPGPDGAGHELTVYVSTQMPHGFATRVAPMFDLDPAKVRGGAARRRRVRRQARARRRTLRRGRGRAAIAAAGEVGRDPLRKPDLDAARSRAGAVRAARLQARRHDRGDAMPDRRRLGAYAGFGGALAMGPTRMMAQGVYRIPKISYECAVALTNTTPMGAFRGAGRPEAAAMLERIIDIAAAELGIDPAEIRRRNFLRPDEFPYTTVMRTEYDSGDYDGALTEALRVAGYDELRREQAERRARGDRVVLGIGVSAYVEITAGGGGSEYGSVTVDAEGIATIRVGTSAHGQGHATSFAMIVADRLQIPLESVRFVQSDTAEVPTGGGTGGSRSLQLGGSAVLNAADGVVAQAREVAATMLEANPDDIVVMDGGVGVAGVPASALTWSQLAQREPIHAVSDFEQAGATFPFGAHVAVVEVDLDTGLVTPVRHVAVDDCGRILNPLIVTGQQHGGIAQGIAQALWEQYVYDDDGNPLTSTLTDYAMPSAAELPSFEASNTETPSPRNALGAKGIGESGTIGSTPAVQSAVVDALGHLGVRHIDIPCTAERVWAAVRDAEAGRLASPWRDPPAVFDSLTAPKTRADAEAVDI